MWTCVFKAHRLFYHSTLGLRVIKKICGPEGGLRRGEEELEDGDGGREFALRDVRQLADGARRLENNLLGAEVLVDLATDTTVYLSRRGKALKVNKLTFTIRASDSAWHPGLPGCPLSPRPSAGSRAASPVEGDALVMHLPDGERECVRECVCVRERQGQRERERDTHIQR